MKIAATPDINLDALRRLDANKTYFLSSTTGRVKEASFWMRFKCRIGVASAQAKVSNLIDALRTSLLDESGQRANAELDTQIKTISRSDMVRGSVIRDVVGRFAPADGQSTARRQAARIAREMSLEGALAVHRLNFLAGPENEIRGLFLHAFRAAMRGPFPVEADGDGNPKLDKAAFRQTLKGILADTQALLLGIGNSAGLGHPRLDKRYARHVKETLFNADGTRNGKGLDALRPLGAFRVDVAFHLGEACSDNRAQAVHNQLLRAGIDPEKKVAEILSLCGKDPELEDFALEVMPGLCYNSNNALRPEGKIQAMFADLRENLAEIRRLERTFPGCAEGLKNALAGLGGAPLPKGLLTRIAGEVAKAPLDKLAGLNSLSSASDIFEGVDQLRKLVASVNRNIDFEKAFAAIGENEIGGPHAMACNMAVRYLAVARLGPAATGRLAHAFSGRELSRTMSILEGFSGALKAKSDPFLHTAEEYKRAKAVVLDAETEAVAIATILEELTGTAFGYEIDPDIPLDGEEASYMHAALLDDIA